MEIAQQRLGVFFEEGCREEMCGKVVWNCYLGKKLVKSCSAAESLFVCLLNVICTYLKPIPSQLTDGHGYF